MNFRSASRRREQIVRHPNLKEILDELEAWLNDKRRYDKGLPRKDEWKSLIRDVRAAAEHRGPKLRRCSLALDHLITKLASTPSTDSAAKQNCLPHSAAARTELAEASAVLAAFDDLVSALRTPTTADDTVWDLLQMLEAALRFADRTLSSKTSLLAGVADNAAWDVAFARHDLDGAPLPSRELDHDADAGLSLEERIDLCRRILTQQASPGHHVVWVAYDRARLKFPGWLLEVGPVTFFDGPTLLRLFKTMDKNARQGLATPQACSSHGRPPELPEELRGEDADELRREPNWPTGLDFWVAARIDLGSRRYADPVRVGRAQADALVNLAGFNNGRSTWRPLRQGHLHLIDGFPRSRSTIYGDSIEYSVPEADYTDHGLEQLRTHLAERLPIDDPVLHELIDAAGVLSEESSDASGLLQDVRIIDLIATRCGTDRASDHLKRSLAARWARDKIVDDIQYAVEAIVDDVVLKASGTMTHLEDVKQHLTTYDGGGRSGSRTHRDVAVAAVVDLAPDLPEHHLASRKIRTLAGRIHDPAALEEWVNVIVAEYEQLVERMIRCRNSLAHGGPVNLEVIASVRPFANWQARLTTALGLQGIIMGPISVNEAHERRRKSGDRWRSDIPTAASILEALFDQPPADNTAANPARGAALHLYT